METQRVQLKEVLPWLVHWARHACSTALSALVSPVQNIFFLTIHYLNLCVPTPHRPATWAGSRAGPPVSECVPTDKTLSTI
jgi:hypothetical protein